MLHFVLQRRAQLPHENTTSTYIHTYIHTRTFIKRLLTKRIQSVIGKGKTEEKKEEPKKRKPTNWEKDDV